MAVEGERTLHEFRTAQQALQALYLLYVRFIYCIRILTFFAELFALSMWE